MEKKFLLKCPLAVAVAVTLRVGEVEGRAARGRRVYTRRCVCARFAFWLAFRVSPVRDGIATSADVLNDDAPERSQERERNSQKGQFLIFILLLTFLLLLFSFGVAPVERRYTKRERRASCCCCCVCVSHHQEVCVWRRRCVCVCVFLRDLVSVILFFRSLRFSHTFLVEIKKQKRKKFFSLSCGWASSSSTSFFSFSCCCC